MKITGQGAINADDPIEVRPVNHLTPPDGGRIQDTGQ